MTNIAQKAVKKVRDESLEVLKTAARQTGMTPSAESSSQEKPPEIHDQDGELTEEQKKKIEAESRARLEKFEKEMARYRVLRRQRDEERRQERIAPEEAVSEEKPAPLPEPTTKQKRSPFVGPKARAERAKRSTEIGKMPSG